MFLHTNQNETYFSIGEFVKLCRTTRATLYHYERQGLLSPIVNRQNGYRFYKLYDYYIFMYVAHLTRIGFSLHEIREYISDKRLETYLQSLEISRVRLAEQQEQLRLRNERTQRGFRVLNRSLAQPINLPRSPTWRSISFVCLQRKFKRIRLHLLSSQATTICRQTEH